MFRLSFMFIALLTAGCVSLDPHYDRPAAPVPATLPGARRRIDGGGRRLAESGQ